MGREGPEAPPLRPGATDSGPVGADRGGRRRAGQGQRPVEIPGLHEQRRRPRASSSACSSTRTASPERSSSSRTARAAAASPATPRRATATRSVARQRERRAPLLPVPRRTSVFRDPRVSAYPPRPDPRRFIDENDHRDGRLPTLRERLVPCFTTRGRPARRAARGHLVRRPHTSGTSSSSTCPCSSTTTRGPRSRRP